MKVPTAKKLPSGQWRTQVMVEGRRVSITASSEKEAIAKAMEYKAGMAQASKDAEDQKRGNITLNDAIDKYIESRRNVLSPSTIRGYKGIQKNYFKNMMQLKVRDIDKPTIQKAVNEDAKTHSSKSLKNAVGLMISAISEYKEINVNGIKYPQKIKKEHAYLDANQIVELITACQGNIAEIPILLAVWLGMRRSEIMGLHWDSVDFEQKKIRIERSIVSNENGEYVEKKELKNTSSRRTISCPDYILSKLEEYQPNKTLRKGRVFTKDPSVIYNNLKRICERSGIPFVGVHGLRHTNASVMLSLGIVDKVAMKRGGWATDDTMKSVYQHVFSSDRDFADDLINSYFEAMLSGN